MTQIPNHSAEPSEREQSVNDAAHKEDMARCFCSFNNGHQTYHCSRCEVRECRSTGTTNGPKNHG